MNNESNPAAGSLLAEFDSLKEFALGIGKSPRTVARWIRLGEGPPLTYVGRTPYVHRQTGMEWLKTNGGKA